MGNFRSGFPGRAPFGPLSAARMGIPIAGPGCKALREMVDEGAG